MNVHFSSQTDMWSTPQDFFDKLDEIYHFQTDICAIADNAKCTNFFTPEQDGLKQDWKGICWCNPPYGRGIGAWLKKAYESSLIGATIVCLIPARTDTAYWHDYVMKGEITFLRGRLKFGGHKNSAPFPSALVVFKNNGCIHEFPPEKIYIDGKLHRDSSNARYHQCVKCEEWKIKKG